ncbi:MAG: hypothetical protein J6J42_05260 [Lachnospiraceae bacterium]|nr:hypothetical protein [Lachnospiraceae bacterium]
MELKQNSGQAGVQGQQQYRQQEQTQQQQKEQKAPQKKQFAFSFSNDKELDKELRKPRSRAYMEIFDAIDMLSATDEEIIEQLKANMDEDTAEEFAEMSVEELLEEIKASFREEFMSLPVEVESILQGVLSKCYISGCDCHAISATGDILEHYDAKLPMPANLEKGRKVYHKFPDCRCVEVYTDCCRVIAQDSTVTKIDNDEI